MTQEELLLVLIFRSKQHPVPIAELAKRSGLSEKGLKHSLHLLTHGNCIRRAGEGMVEITDHGKSICKHYE
jgi:hypothetical protein